MAEEGVKGALKERNDSARGGGGKQNERAVQGTPGTRQRRSGGSRAPGSGGGRARRLPGRGRGAGGGWRKGRSGGKGRHGERGRGSRGGGVRAARAGTHRPRTSPAWWGSSGPCRVAAGSFPPPGGSAPAQRGRSPAAAAAAPPRCLGPGAPGRSAMLRKLPSSRPTFLPPPPSRAEPERRRGREREGRREGGREGGGSLRPGGDHLLPGRPAPGNRPRLSSGLLRGANGARGRKGDRR